MKKVQSQPNRRRKTKYIWPKVDRGETCTYPKIRQSFLLGAHPRLHKLLPINRPIAILIKQIHHHPHHILLLARIDVLGALIVEPVRAPHLVGRPGLGFVVVVQGEEGGWIHVGDVVLFGHMAGGPVGVVGDGDLMPVLEGEGGEEGEEGEQDCGH